MLSVGAKLEAIVGGMMALALLVGLGIKFHTAAARVIAALGALSYSLHLVHVPIGGRVVNLGRRVIDAPFEALVGSTVALLVSFF
jgi:peptidoglycan/LPS O-acetylase OafA/YrhL